MPAQRRLTITASCITEPPEDPSTRTRLAVGWQDSPRLVVHGRAEPTLGAVATADGLRRTPHPRRHPSSEYQTFATVGEDDPVGDEKAFALTRQSRLIPIVATQSISSLRAVLGQSEAWRALLQTLRTRIFLSLADDSSVQIASALCGQVTKMKASYSVSEQTSRATASLLSGSPGGGAGSLSASRSFSERREPLFHPRVCRGVVDGIKAVIH